jgi:uncharacterized Zn finger protein
VATYNPNFQRRPDPAPRLHPKKVRSGIKLTEGVGGVLPWSSSWAAQRWIRIVESVDDGQNLVEGLNYAKIGQTKTLTADGGGISASIQGRSDRPYTVSIGFETFGDEQWHKIIKAMSEGAVYSAKLLSGELPTNIDDLFIPLGLKLFPTEVSELKVSCTCRKIWAAATAHLQQQGQPPATGGPEDAAPGDQGAATDPPAPSAPPPPPPAPPVPAAAAAAESDSGDRWCKHACCAAYLFAERLTTDPFLMFRLRGMPGVELLDRLRHMRSVGQQGAGLYVGRVPGVSDIESPELDAVVETFWEMGPQLAELDMTIAAPPITHPLLRRLGPSPFGTSTFPLVGLLASCYDSISADTLKRAEEFASGDETLSGDGEDSSESAGDDDHPEG